MDSNTNNRDENNPIVDSDIANTPISYSNIEEKDKEHDVDNKHFIYWYSLVAIGILYLVAFVVLGFSFYNIYNTRVKDGNWMLLTCSLILLSMPITLHFTLINKLYKKNNVEHALEHPIINSVASLINTIVSKLNK